jgi:hypothetical protein
MDGGVIPFGRPRRKRPTHGFDRAAYDRAALQQERDRRLSRTPVPARITLALDLRGLHGDRVDRDLGVWDPPDGWTGPGWEPGTAVDRWEDGTLTPTREQMLALSRLTGMPWRFFYSPVEDMPGRVFVCERHRGGRGLTVMRNEVDHNGVLRSFCESDDGPDDEPEPQAEPMLPHRFDRDCSDPVVCRHCGLPQYDGQHDDGPGLEPDERR